MRTFKSIVLVLLAGIMMQGCMESKTQNPQNSETNNYALQASEVTPVLTGTAIPDVSVTSVEGERQRLLQLVKDKPTVLIFYRGGWCPYCNKHMAQLQEIHSDLVDLGYQVLAISPDKPEFLEETMQGKELGYTLLSDSDMEATKAFGLAFKVEDETVERYKNNGMDLAERSGHDHQLLPVPAVFLVNPDGMITFQYVNPDYKTRVNSEVLLVAAKAYYPSES